MTAALIESGILKTTILVFAFGVRDPDDVEVVNFDGGAIASMAFSLCRVDVGVVVLGDQDHWVQRQTLGCFVVHSDKNAAAG